MARKKAKPETGRTKVVLARRLTEVRTDRSGEQGAAKLARALGVPARTRYHDERGVTVPAEVLLRLIERAGAEPAWLFHGRGAKYRVNPAGGSDGPPIAGGLPASLLARQLSRLLEGGRLEIEVSWTVSRKGRGL
jgi:hypothetical protein